MLNPKRKRCGRGRDRPIVVPLPADGTLTAGPYAPAPGATNMIIGTGAAEAAFVFEGDGGTVEATGTCEEPETPVHLVDAAIL